MADEEPAPNTMNDLIWVVFVLAIIVFAWFATGGPSRANLSSLFLQSPLSGYGTSTVGAATTSPWYPTVPENSVRVGHIEPAFEKVIADLRKNPSLMQNAVTLAGTDGARSNEPQGEYVVIQASYNLQNPINITGWKIMSIKSGNTAVIGTAVVVPITGSSALPGAVTLAAGDRAVVTSGRSPIGVSFRVNKCSGYLAQFQTFSPPLTTSCPAATSELYARGGPLTKETACVAAADRIEPCKAPLSAPAASAQCSQFLLQVSSYNSCVNIHRNDRDFSGHEWRLYEGGSKNLWNDTGDTLVLLDGGGRLVSAISY